jgi:hypothetical protein
MALGDPDTSHFQPKYPQMLRHSFGEADGGRSHSLACQSLLGRRVERLFVAMSQVL